jgi:hypothetical protein
MFSTVDCDNWMPEVYFEEIELFLSKHGWNMNRYLFGPQQMFTINSKQIPFVNQHADFMLGAGILVWCNTLTKVQNVTSNYSMGFNAVKRMGFYDVSADGMADDFHTSCKAMWKNNGDFEIIQIYVMANLMSLESGEGYFHDISARFWQAERHMRSMLDAAYNFNMLCKSPFHWRTLWFTVSYFENHFVPLGLFLSAFMFIIFKLINGLEFTPAEMTLMQLESFCMTSFSFCYFIAARKSARVLYHQKEISWRMLVAQALVSKFIMLGFVALPQLIATIKIGLATPTYETCAKIVKNAEEYKQD